MSKARVIIAICILIAGLFGYVIGKNSTRIAPTTNNTQLNLPYEQVKVSGINSAQQKQLEDFVGKFYEYQQQKEIDKLLALFTPAANTQEQDELDFLLGKDLAHIGAKLQTRLFTTQGYNYTIGGYYIRGIARHNDTTTFLVDEMRVIYSGGEYVGFSVNIVNLALEIEQAKTEQKVVKYYHNNLRQNDLPKYDGFRAE